MKYHSTPQRLEHAVLLPKFDFVAARCFLYVWSAGDNAVPVDPGPDASEAEVPHRRIP